MRERKRDQMGDEVQYVAIGPGEGGKEVRRERDGRREERRGRKEGSKEGRKGRVTCKYGDMNVLSTTNHTSSRIARIAAATARISVIFNVGLVGVSNHTSLVFAFNAPAMETTGNDISIKSNSMPLLGATIFRKRRWVPP